MAMLTSSSGRLGTRSRTRPARLGISAQARSDRRQGVAGNWVWWAFVITGVATIFFYARLWRRSGVLTDLEFYELRYSGKSASAVRGFRAGGSGSILAASP